MDRIEKAGVVYCAFPHLAETGLVRHGFSTKHGGVSKNEFATMNLSVSRGDNPANVSENIARMKSALQIKDAETVFCQQTHETRVVCVNKSLVNNGNIYLEGVYATDGLITNTSGLALVTMHADCVPLFFLDPVKKAIGMTHAGWRGTLNDIAGETVRRMTGCFGSQAKDMLVGIGPSIGSCCFEVGAEVVGAFREKWDFADEIIENNREKLHINLQKANTKLLCHMGVSINHIEIAGICTMCNKDDFFSHRRDGAARGSMAAFLALR